MAFENSMGTNTCGCHLCYSLALSEAYHCHCPLPLLALAPPLSGFVLEHIQLLNISTLPDSVMLRHLSATSDTPDSLRNSAPTLSNQPYTASGPTSEPVPNPSSSSQPRRIPESHNSGLGT